VARPDIPELKSLDEESLPNFNDLLHRLALIFQGLISFGDGTTEDNIDGRWATVADTGNADTEFTFAHGLGRTPVGFFVMNIDKGGVVYDSGTSWDATDIYLKCSAANAAVTLFVI